MKTISNFRIAGHYYELSAAQGNDSAEDILGSMYELGDGVHENYASAHYYRLAVAQGDEYGEFGLVRLYETGHGVPQDFAAVLHCYKLSAVQGNPAAAAALTRLSRLDFTRIPGSSRVCAPEREGLRS